MRRLASFSLLVALLALLSAPTAGPSATSRHVSGGTATISPWIALDLELLSSHSVNPPRAARGLALVSVAMFRAERAAPRRGRRAAIAGAAGSVLVYLFPDETGRVRMLARRAARTHARALAVGERIGGKVVARGLDDRSGSAWSGQVPVGPGYWVPTPPAFQPPLEPLAGTWRPWNVVSGVALRPSPPPRPGSTRFETELREVYDVSRSLTADQKRIADFWADGPGTVTPPGRWNEIALGFVRSRRLSTHAAARLFATLNTAQADAFICAWDAKYTYWSLRPVTAIQRELDPDWSPYLTTPPFPSYVSGHSTTSGAASEVLARFFPKRRAQLRAWAQEAAISRLYAGIHFRSDNEAGLRLGRRVGAAAIAASRTSALWLRP